MAEPSRKISTPAYRRSSLRNALPRHHWKQVKFVGMPLPADAPSIDIWGEVLKCSLVIMILRYVLARYPLLAGRITLERAIEAEESIKSEYKALLEVRRKKGRY